MKILVIIPAYNEQDNIEKVVMSLEQININVDYLIINDCSRDETRNILSKKGYPHINLPVNLGIGGGVQTGYIYAQNNDYDIAVQMDGDGQHNPEYIKDLIAPIIDGTADMVIGSRFITKEGFQSSRLRRLGIDFLSFLIKLLCNINVKDVTSGFRAVNKKLISLFAADYAQDYPEPEAIVTAAMNNAHIEEVPVIMNERSGGVSSISSWKSMYYMIKVSITIIVLRISGKKNNDESWINLEENK